MNATAPSHQIDHNIAAFLTHLDGVKRDGSGWKARCPAHDDKNPSLSVKQGDDGRVLLFCRAGCETRDVLAALKVTAADLFPTNGHKTGHRPAAARTTITRYTARDEAGQPHAVHVRTDRPGAQKSVHWEQLDGTRGLAGRPVETLPLFGAELLRERPGERVVLTEGEKACLALRGVGYLALGTVTGAPVTPHDDVLAVLRGRDVLLWPDHDDIGRSHMARIGARLTTLGIAWKRVTWPGAREKDDAVDFLARESASALPGLLAAAVVPPDEPTPVDKPDPPDFPLEVFPAVVRRYVADSAEALGVAPDLIAVPLLAMAGGAIGNSRALVVKPSWVEYPILWTAVIAPPGSGKSPALAVARHALDTLQRAAWDAYQQRLVIWERDAAANKDAKQDASPRPALEHFHTVDATTEALARILAASGGVTLVRDELAGWVKAFDAYRKGGDRETFLSLWAGQPLKVDRRTAEPLFVERPVLCVAGGIQPDRLPELRGDGALLDGFVDRFIFSYPITRPQRWTEAMPDPRDRAAVEQLFARLRVPGDGETRVALTPEGRRLFAEWYDENAGELASARGLAAGFAAKLPGQLARLTLVLHCLNQPDDHHGAVPAETVADGVQLVEYFAAHLDLVLPALDSPAANPRAVGLPTRVARILDRANGGWVDRTALSRGLGGRTLADDLTTALATLAGAGLAESRTMPTGARPREEWRATRRRYGDMENSPESGDESRTAEYEDIEKSPTTAANLHNFITSPTTATPDGGHQRPYVNVQPERQSLPPGEGWGAGAGDYHPQEVARLGEVGVLRATPDSGTVDAAPARERVTL